LVIDKKLPVKTLYKSCGPRGCKSRLVMSKKLRARFAKAKTVSVKVASTDGRVISFNLGFKGFAKALKDIAR
jgi:invasion protein IalB